MPQLSVNTFDVIPSSFRSFSNLCSFDFKKRSTTCQKQQSKSYENLRNISTRKMCSNLRICGSQIFIMYIFSFTHVIHFFQLDDLLFKPMIQGPVPSMVRKVLNHICKSYFAHACGCCVSYKSRKCRSVNDLVVGGVGGGGVNPTRKSVRFVCACLRSRCHVRFDLKRCVRPFHYPSPSCGRVLSFVLKQQE